MTVKRRLRHDLLTIWVGLAVGFFAHAAWAAHDEMVMHQTQDVRIGVLALRGEAAAHEHWDDTATYLTAKMPGYRFSIVAVSFDEIESFVAARKLSFVIVNPAIYVVLAERYGASPVATLINRLDDYDASLYGGVVFRQSGSNDVAKLEWLKGKRFIAVDPMSLGGFLAANLELRKKGLDPYKDFASLEFAGTHDAAVLAVLGGQADAGTVRTDVLERMANDGVIDLAQVEVVAPYKDGQNGNFPYLRSTRLYPEWPFAKLKDVPDHLARQVSMVLLSMPPDSSAARNAEIVGWNVPMSYIPVVELLRTLELPPFEPKPITLADFIEQQRLAALLIVGGGVVTCAFLISLFFFNQRLRRAKISLVQANEVLEDRVQERTVELQARENEMEQLATHDPLTGLLNRRALETRMLDEVNRVNRYSQHLSVLMIDIDHFKKVNDGFGHLVGDQVLRDLACLIEKWVRNTDLVARYGGEEFVVLLPMTNREDAFVLAERLRKEVADQDIVLTNGHIIRITISIGIASAPLNGNARADGLLDMADQAMYLAKQGGRNQVSIYRLNE